MMEKKILSANIISLLRKTYFESVSNKQLYTCHLEKTTICSTHSLHNEFPSTTVDSLAVYYFDLFFLSIAMENYRLKVPAYSRGKSFTSRKQGAL